MTLEAPTHTVHSGEGGIIDNINRRLASTILSMVASITYMYICTTTEAIEAI